MTASPSTNTSENTALEHHKILIVGGGTAGISVAHRLMRAIGNVGIAIIEPSEKHY